MEQQGYYISSQEELQARERKKSLLEGSPEM
jgi:hypothetical protein